MKTLLTLLLFSFLTPSYAIINELGFDFGYDKQIYGTNKNNSIVSRSYSIGISSYVFSTTAIDMSYSYTQDITSNNDKYTITGYTVDHLADQQRVKSKVYSIGLKQMLAPRTSIIVPMISMGYARQITDSDSDSTYLNTSNNTTFSYISPTTVTKSNSVFGAFMLQLRLSERLSLKASVKTIFPAFEFNEAKNNLKYSIGFSWLF